MRGLQLTGHDKARQQLLTWLQVNSHTIDNTPYANSYRMRMFARGGAWFGGRMHVGYHAGGKHANSGFWRSAGPQPGRGGAVSQPSTPHCITRSRSLWLQSGAQRQLRCATINIIIIAYGLPGRCSPSNFLLCGSLRRVCLQRKRQARRSDVAI